MIDTEQSPLRWLFIDFNSYFASVEQQVNPHLRDKPLVVAPMLSDSTCAIAASYEAKAFGISTGTSIRDAKIACPGLMIVPARHELYVDYHHKLLEEIDRHIPVTKVWSIDEMACRLDLTERDPEAGTALAKRIKQGIAERVGVCLKSSIGLAPSSLLAKIGSDLRKPDGLVVLRSRDLPGPLLDLKLTDLPGIGERMHHRLNMAGVTSVSTLWKLAPKHACAIWGGVGGERFWYELHGFDVPNIATARSLIGHSRVLAPDARAAPMAKIVARTLALKAAYRLRRYDLAAGGFFLGGDRWESGWVSQVRFSPTQDSFVFLHWLDQLWPGLAAKAGARASFRHVQIGLFDLVPARTRQHDLFLRADVQASRTHKHERLWHIMDGLNDRYGRETVTLASQMGQNLHYEAKIAFNRVPDRFEFLQTAVEPPTICQRPRSVPSPLAEEGQSLPPA
jgi:DNA polymerase-4